MPETYRNIIGGERRSSASTFESRSPANWNEVIGVFPASTSSDVDDAVAAARAAFPAWKRTPAPRRAEILYRAAELLAQRKEEIAQVMTREMGKVLLEARGDVQEGVDMLYYIAGEGRRLFGETTPPEMPNKFAMSVREPIGVCGLITPWNFPLAIPSWKIAPALVSGNTIVFKPAEDTPLVAQLFAELLIECGLPPGVLNVVHGAGEVGAAVANHPGIDMISFTGSTETGRSVAHACAETYKRCSLEMGGKNAVIILDDADLDLAVDGCIWGAYGTSGQRCTASSRIIVDEKRLDEFLSRFVDRVKELAVGDGLDESNLVGPVINESQLNRIHGYVEIGKGEGAQLLCGGDIEREGACSGGWFYQPTVFSGVTPNMRIAQEEIFGPVTSIIAVNGLDHALEVANGVKYGLSSAIFTRDVNRAFQAVRDLEAGICYVNSATIGAEVHLPFGGVKRTGNGHREGGHSIDAFTEWKTVYVDYSGVLQRAQIDT
jgi:aldehyde dehydrogenase (NAD+)